MLRALFSHPLPEGSQAPEFTLPDQDGSPVSLSRLRGRNVVLIFYPGDDTPVCRKQLCEFRDEAALAAGKDAVVLGMNPAGKASHAAFRSKFGLPFSLLVDAGGRVARMYNAKGLWIRRTVYVIGKDGRIRYGRRGKPAVAEVLAAAE